MFLDGMINRLLGAFKWLALPVAALLFLQWPLREIIQAWSREANDLGQWLFALFVAASVVAATRAKGHLASDAMAQRFTDTTRSRFNMLALALALVPWTLFVLWSGWTQIMASIVGRERFPDTGNFGYFVLKSALLLLMGLILAQAFVDVRRWLATPRPRP
jgi:TRAP-type mannitol/chloroaromatic compound transport system permease small subunit